MFIEGVSDNKLKINVDNADETLYIGETLGKTLEKGAIVALNGNLGAGKTVLVKGIAKGLEITEEPNSPTFVILQTYRGKYPLYHFDFYRLSSASELSDINYEDFFYGEGITVVEWAERISEVFPDTAINIKIEIPDHEETDGPAENRIITITSEEQWLLSFKNTAEQVLQA